MLQSVVLIIINSGAFMSSEKLDIVHLPKTWKFVGFFAFASCPLRQLRVEPGAKIDCYCENLANKLQLLDGVYVTGDAPPYRVQA